MFLIIMRHFAILEENFKIWLKYQIYIFFGDLAHWVRCKMENNIFRISQEENIPQTTAVNT